jgi:acyl-CoA carboxylase subunit beta
MKIEPRSSLDAAGWATLVLDPGWKIVADELRSRDPIAFPGYEPGAESVLCASGAVAGTPAEAIVFDFDAFGGSLGVVAGERIAAAFERALVRRAGVVALVATGGARMQEGMVALAQMAKTVVARGMLAKHALPFVAYLRNPTTGGVYASFGALADVVWAEPGATIGFGGPRVAERMSGAPLPPGSHTAEFALENGLIDGIVEPQLVRDRVAALFDAILGEDAVDDLGRPPLAHAAPLDGWAEATLARHPGRPTGRAFAEALADDIVEIRGDRAGTSDPGVLAGLGRIGGRRVAILAHERRMMPPGAFRLSQRLIRAAARFALPLVTFVDTPGADASSASEAGGVARAIAGVFRDVLDHPRATVAAVTGEGGSGGAFAFACCDRVIALQHAIFSVIAPEGAATILRREDVASVARDLRLTSRDLRALGIADTVVAEPEPGAHEHPQETTRRLGAAIAAELADLGDEDRRPERAERWRTAGNRFLEGL